MTKRTIKETVTEYDKDGKIVTQTVTETTEEEDAPAYPYYPYNGGIVYTTDPAIYKVNPADVTCKTATAGYCEPVEKDGN